MYYLNVVLKLHCSLITENVTDEILLEKVECSNDNFARERWNIDKENDCVSNLKGENIVIAILDTGIQESHRALKGRVMVQHSLNFTSSKKDDIKDMDGHGTRCAGVAAGNQFECTRPPNSPNKVTFLGGVAPKAKLIVCKVYEGKSQINLQAVESALEHICSLHDREICHIHVVSMSFKIPGNPPLSLQQKINALTDRGTICVAAAGNYGAKSERPITCPASCQNVIAVGAHNHRGKLSEQSSDDPDVRCLALGENVCAPTVGDNEALINCSGTSYAAPALAGLIALIIQVMRKHNELVNFTNIKRIVEQIPKVCGSNEKALDPRSTLVGALDNKRYLHELMAFC